MKVCRCWYYFKSTFNFSSLVAQKESAACSHCCFLKEQCFSPPLTMYVFVWSGDTDVFSLGGRLFPNVLRVQVLPVDVLQSWGTSVRSQIIQAAQACPRLKDDVLGDSSFFCFLKKMKKAGHRGTEVLQTQGVTVLQGGQETWVFKVWSLGFILPIWWWLHCSMNLESVGDDSQRGWL